jgi:hypothetical protein
MGLIHLMSQDLLAGVGDWFKTWGITQTVIVAAMISVAVTVSASLITAFLEDPDFI